MNNTISLSNCIIPILLIAFLSTLIMVRQQVLKSRKTRPVIYFITFLVISLIVWFLVFKVVGIPTENMIR